MHILISHHTSCTAQDGFCRYRSSEAIAKDGGYKDIPHGDEDALKEAVATVGPISVAIDAGHRSFQVHCLQIATMMILFVMIVV